MKMRREYPRTEPRPGMLEETDDVETMIDAIEVDIIRRGGFEDFVIEVEIDEAQLRIQTRIELYLPWLAYWFGRVVLRQPTRMMVDGTSKHLGALECVAGRPFQVSTTTVVLPKSKRQRGPEVVRG